MSSNYSAIFSITVLILWLVYLAVRRVTAARSRRKQRSVLGLAVPKRVPLWDPVFGTDLNISILKQIRSCRLLAGLESRFVKHGNTHAFPLGMTSIIATSDPENVRAILTDAKTFPVGDVRRQGLSILHGCGIFAVEGAEWQQSRAALRPAFAKGQHDDVAVLETHFQEFLERIRHANYRQDMQDGYHRLTMDTAMEFFFGVSPHQGSNSFQVDQFLESIDYVNDTVYLSLVFGTSSLVVLWRWWQNKKALKFVHNFVEEHVRQVLTPAVDSGKCTDGKYIFLEELSKTVKDPIVLRDQVLTSMLGGKDTTASLLSHVTFELARNPEIWAKLQQAVGTLPSCHSDMKTIRSLDYVRYCLLEGLRLYTVVPINMRCASMDTSLPVGGGHSGREPIQVADGTVIWLGMYSMHRRTDLWGDDADKFNPSRWEGLDPGMEFSPFGAGPRTCLGQQFAMNEASFVLTRFAQTFDRLEPASSAPWSERVAITLGLANGCEVKVHERT